MQSTERSADERNSRPDPGRVIADAVRDLAREAAGTSPPRTCFTGKEALGLLVIVIDLALLAALFKLDMDTPLAKFLTTLLPLLFGGTMVAYQDGIHRFVQRRWTLPVASLAGVILLLLLFAYFPVLLRTEPLTALAIDGKPLGHRPDGIWTVRIRTFEPHQVKVTEILAGQEYFSEVQIDRRDLLAAAALNVLGRVLFVPPPAYRLDARFPVEINKGRGAASMDIAPASMEKGVTTLEMEGDFPRLLLKEMERHPGEYYVQRGTRGRHRLGIFLSPARLQDQDLPPGRFYFRLIRPGCTQELGWRRIERAPQTELNFESIPCTDRR
ncbi:MAG TPA: hypothetical protein VHG28_10740 [Longimicrobiaceae bacterium]|nr:hypothetical protein [Longimicrobiaceae bacterium]